MSEQPSATKTRKGCMYWGCIMGLILMLVFTMSALFGLRYAKRMVNEFTDLKPAELPKAQVSDAQMADVRRRIQDFRTSMDSGQKPEPLALTADEINGLIATEPGLKVLRDKLYLTIEGGQAKARVSVPMEEVGLPLFHGRYLNAQVDLKLSFENGSVRLAAQNVTAKGKRLPDVYQDAIGKQNLARSLDQDPQTAPALERLQDVQVKDGTLVFVPK